VLHEAEIERQQHLPGEQFHRMLGQFAANMMCELGIGKRRAREGSVGMQTVTVSQLISFVESDIK
jgi:hypothetical protein